METNKKDEAPLVLEEVRAQMKQVKAVSMSFPGGKQIFTRRDLQARIFIGENPLFYDRAGLWWLWDKDNKHYKMVDEIDLLNRVADGNLAEDTITAKIRMEILNSLKQVGRRNIPDYEIKGLVQFKDGLVHPNDPEAVLEPTPAYFITNPVPWEYGKSEDTPTIDNLFKSWVGEKYVETLYQITAYCLYPDYPIERIFCFVGGGSNGKSSYLYLLRKFLGDTNITSTELDTLINSRFEAAKLHKKLVCLMGETNFAEISKTALLKRLVSGKDPVSIEYKNKMPFDWVNYSKILIATNSLPSTGDKTDGFYRKWLLIDFPNQFKEGVNPVYSVPDEEFSNLGRKCLRILKELIQCQAFKNEGDWQERRDRYEERSNPFDKFWSEFVDSGEPEDYITKREFSNKLNQWLSEKRRRQLSDVSIAKAMGAKGIEEGRVFMKIGGNEMQPRAWMGVKWKGISATLDRFATTSHSITI